MTGGELSDYICGLRVLFKMSGDKFSKTKQGMSKIGDLPLLMTKEQKYYVLETVRSTFAVTLPLVHLNLWDAKLAIPNDTIYARLETHMGIRQDKKGQVLEDKGTPSDNTTCAWMAADEAVVCTRAFVTTCLFYRRLVSRGRLEVGLHVNDISRIHWSQQTLAIQSERPN
ncbi:uncharacterized protein TNCV_1563401 [Trichonephila clavipes]|nr:uncharacterized protein TNCV_1563401 [Trichonephila clavipes]